MHKVVNALTIGSVGDLGKIAGALAEAGFNVVAVGGGEGHALGSSIGLVSLIIEDDEGHEDDITGLLTNLVLDNGRQLVEVAWYDSLVAELQDQPGELARAGAILGNAGHNIMSVISIDTHRDMAHVAFAFESAATRDDAARVLKAEGIGIIEH